jgi:hypothetical protein
MAPGNGPTDLVIFWKNQVIPNKIKVHYGTRSQLDGVRQRACYMDKLGQKQGYLVIFEKKSSEDILWE